MYTIIDCDDPETDKVVFAVNDKEYAEKLFQRLRESGTYDSLLLKSPDGRILKTHTVR